MASDAPDSSRAGEEAAEREEYEALAALLRQHPWVALSFIPVVYGGNEGRAEALSRGTTDFLLELQAPPRPSYLALPERLAHDPRLGEPHTFVVAAAPARVLFMAGRGFLDAGYFLCYVRLPPVRDELRTKLFPSRSIGIIADQGRI